MISTKLLLYVLFMNCKNILAKIFKKYSLAKLLERLEFIMNVPLCHSEYPN